MIPQRTMQTALRRIAAQRTPFRTVVPAAVTTTQARGIAESGAHVFGAKSETTQVSPKDIATGASEQLVQQRLRRPVSPHLSIYRPQITWYGSILNRITGSILSGGFYIFGFGYLVAPLFGWHLESTTMVAAFGSMGLVAKSLVKFTVAWPFVYHSLNGVRHLAWDTGRQLGNKQVQRTGWFVMGATTVAALGLAMIGGH